VDALAHPNVLADRHIRANRHAHTDLHTYCYGNAGADQYTTAFVNQYANARPNASL
jgi:hypothetical protein